MGNATRSTNLGLYSWESQDKLSESIPQVSSNFQALDEILSRAWIDIKSYGYDAKGNYNLSTGNGTDDAPAFQKALDRAQNRTSSVTIFVPDGTYRLGSELRIYSNTAIIMSPNATLVRDHSKYLLFNGVRAADGGSPISGYNGDGNILIQGGTLTGQGNKQTAKASIVHFGHAQNITFDNVTLKDCSNSHHIEFNACKDVYVKNCNFLGWYGTVDTYNEAIQLDLATPELTTVAGGDYTPCKNVYIDNTYFGKSTTAGSKPIGRGIGSHSGAINRWHENVHITNCTFDSTVEWACRAYAYKDFYFTNNQIINCGRGVNVRSNISTDDKDTIDANTGAQTGKSQNVARYVIANNTFGGSMTGGRAIEIYGEETGRIYYATVTGNTINVTSVTTGEMVYLNYVRYATVTGNNVSGDSKATCIGLNGNTTEVTIGNNICAFGDRGIAVYGAKVVMQNISILGNTIRGMQRSGIHLDSIDGFACSGNSIFDCNKASGGDENHIRVVVGNKNGTISGNLCTVPCPTSIYVSNTNSRINVTGNVLSGGLTNNSSGGASSNNI
ncbi:putative tailspike, beta-helical glycoside hydrolase [Bacillus phage Andromeda]|uniref:Tailspike, beta-helical glycoside hydrolase n=1 Tax=Bacillus phage Andromeda TaxID=2880537 RepID=M1HNJ6_9CAUD|nr:tail spike protein [Bacillus phage Andromeda]AGE61098.1 putative tailspike, beta-helical glycoside hydrolase [Bacillus phage Andromeda]